MSINLADRFPDPGQALLKLCGASSIDGHTNFWSFGGQSGLEHLYGKTTFSCAADGTPRCSDG